MKTKRKFLSFLMTAVVLLTFFTGCTKKFSDKLFECAGEQTTFYEKYLNSNYENYDPSIFDE